MVNVVADQAPDFTSRQSDRLTSSLTSSATKKNPRPASPARAAPIDAFIASRLDRQAMSLMASEIAEMLLDDFRNRVHAGSCSAR
jgi:hypothetical protein